MSVSLTTVAPSGRGAGRSPGRPIVQSPLEEPKWSARRTLAFAVVVCGAFWLSVGAGIVWLVRAVA